MIFLLLHLKLLAKKKKINFFIKNTIFNVLRILSYYYFNDYILTKIIIKL